MMRILDQKKIVYEWFDYSDTGMIAGDDVAKVLNEDPAEVFKTLVTVSTKNINYVFMVPVNAELDLKKAAASVNEKSVSMIRSRELLPLTGYIHGGCSPVGMKKQFRTVIDSSALDHEKIYFSAGKVGLQLKVAVKDLEKLIRPVYADLKK